MVEQGSGRIRVETWPESTAGGRFGRLWPLDGFAAVGRWLGGVLADELAKAQLLPWIATAFGAGTILYFAADREPVAFIVVLLAGLAALGTFLLRRTRFFPPFVLTAACLMGFAGATLRTAHVSHNVLTRPLYGVSLAGFIETREARERTDRFVLRVSHMEDSRTYGEPAPALQRVRLSVKKGTAPQVGSFVELKASLNAPLSPLRPGSYDFARDLYFQGIGATGLVRGPIKLAAALDDGGLWLRYTAFIYATRNAIDTRIRQSLSGDSSAIASALFTGTRDAITTPVNDAMFISGLGHVLSISGYHMAVVAGLVFFVVRALLALSPRLAASVPIKKIAAAIAFVAALFYLLLSGAEVATQRSFLMTAVVLIAVIVDRRAITFRTLAIAALAVLTLAPEAIVHPSFQMSFAATLGLVALIQHGLSGFSGSADRSTAARIAAWGGREVMALVLASTVAGLATMPYAAFHFHRATPYGVLANLLAMPVVSAWVMPMGLLALLAMPFGFDGVLWQLMNLGIGWMITISTWVAALPSAVGHVAVFGNGPLLLATLGIVLFALMTTALRWSGAIFLVAATLWALSVPQPDLLISADGSSLAARGSDGRLHIVQTRKDAFIAREWLAADADSRSLADPSVIAGTGCDPSGCAIKLADGRFATIAQRVDAFADDCVKAAVIVAWREAPADCAAMVINRTALWSSGSLALRWERTHFAIDATRPPSFDRPWAHREDRRREPATIPADTSAEQPARSGKRSTRNPPPVDATPAEGDLQADQ